MWLFMSAIVVCLTIVVMFFLFGKLMESKWRSERLMQSDIHRQQQYHAVTQLPKPKAEMPDFTPKYRPMDRPRALNATSHSHTIPSVEALQMEELQMKLYKRRVRGLKPRDMSTEQLVRLKEQYLRRDMDNFIEEQRQGGTQ